MRSGIILFYRKAKLKDILIALSEQILKFITINSRNTYQIHN